MAYRDLLIGSVDREGDITMPELAARLMRERQVVVHPASLSHFLKVIGFTVRERCSLAKPIAMMWHVTAHVAEGRAAADASGAPSTGVRRRTGTTQQRGAAARPMPDAASG